MTMRGSFRASAILTAAVRVLSSTYMPKVRPASEQPVETAARMRTRATTRTSIMGRKAVQGGRQRSAEDRAPPGQSSGGSCGTNRRLLVQPAVDAGPVDVTEERLDVLRLLGGLVVAHVGVFPDVHDQQRLEPGRNPVLVKRDPLVGEASGCRILEENRPPDAAHAADGLEVRLPRFERSEGLHRGLGQPGALGRVRIRGLLQVGKIVLVEDHAVVLEPEV